ncbi:hypothetical protein ACOCEA_02605 [Maribacter sp. CXY002]|uniref:hypothetical protein n=1 Tax=Maribacter luteocoastalis TaxID=3407671 RepID=UPI003B68130F
MKLNLLIVFSVLGVFFGCKKKSAPKPPEQALLVFPEKNSECTTGVDLDANTSQVEFRWQQADNVQTYELRVANSNTGTVQTISTSSTTARLPLTKGQSFSWVVRSRNNQVEQSVSSEMWHFYTAGSRTTFAPFPAEIISPKMSEKIFKDINNEIELSWTAADLDNDISGYKVYFSNENPPNTLVAALPNNSFSYKVTVLSGSVYYWSILTEDEEGNVSNSGIYSFTAL